jgi:TolB-like protein
MAVTDLGPTQLKNIERSIRVYSLQVGVPARAKPATEAKPEPKKRSSLAPLALGFAALVVLVAAGAWYFLAANRAALVTTRAPAPVASNAAPPAQAAHLSIVVLPFKNLSGDPSQDYFADGITDNLTTDLSRVRDSFVIASTTAFTFKGKAVDAKEIGKELGVRYVLEGSVQRDQNRVRVNAQLIDAESGAHLWADRFEEDLADLFKLQDQVVARLGNTLGNELVTAEAEKGGRTQSPDASDLVMRGRAALQQWWRSPGPDNDYYNVARAFFERALQIEPNNADALAFDAATYLIERNYRPPNPPTIYDAKILGQADRAIALAPNNPMAYALKSEYFATAHRPDEALGDADAGLAIDPNYAWLYGSRGLAEIFLGRFEQAKSDLRQASRLSPRDPGLAIWRYLLGAAELGLGHFDAAIDEYRNAADSGLRQYFVYSNLAAAYALEGKMDEAKTALAEARLLNPKLTVKWLQFVAPNIPALFEGLREAGLPEE